MYIDHRILVVDDDREDRTMIEGALRETGAKYKIISAADGTEALERIDELQKNGELPCLVILDVNMPRMNGKETLERIKGNERTRETPVVVFGTADEAHQDDFFTAYGAQYFPKPIDYDHFCSTVSEFLSVCEHANANQDPVTI